MSSNDRRRINQRGATHASSERARVRWLRAYGIDTPVSDYSQPSSRQEGWQLDAPKTEAHSSNLHPIPQEQPQVASFVQKLDLSSFMETHQLIQEALNQFSGFAALVQQEWVAPNDDKREACPQVELHGAQLPADQAELHTAIEHSRFMLQLPNNWDTEGSPAYKETTWRRAIDLLGEYATEGRKLLHRDLPVPRILNGPEGSIDIHWRSPNRELLLNVPAGDAEAPTYYGDNRTGGEHVEGQITPPLIRKWLLMWLME
jgi:hypothetical protein